MYLPAGKLLGWGGEGRFTMLSLASLLTMLPLLLDILVTEHNQVLVRCCVRAIFGVKLFLFLFVVVALTEVKYPKGKGRRCSAWRDWVRPWNC